MEDRGGLSASTCQCYSGGLIGSRLGWAQVGQPTGCPKPQLGLSSRFACQAEVSRLSAALPPGSAAGPRYPEAAIKAVYL